MRANRGFTLIELTLVIVIIAILAKIMSFIWGPLIKQYLFLENQQRLMIHSQAVVTQLHQDLFLQSVSSIQYKKECYWDIPQKGGHVVIYYDSKQQKLYRRVNQTTTHEYNVSECQTWQDSNMQMVQLKWHSLAQSYFERVKWMPLSQ